MATVVRRVQAISLLPGNPLLCNSSASSNPDFLVADTSGSQARWLAEMSTGPLPYYRYCDVTGTATDALALQCATHSPPLACS